MSKTYGNLNLRKIRDELGLDFAHYTYGKGQCSCCYGPQDMASIYWKNRVIPEGDNFKSILFKNSYNGNGRIKNKSELIRNYTCIMHHNLSFEERIAFAKKLKEQLDDDYIICVPKSETYTLIILYKEGSNYEEYYKDMRSQKDKDGSIQWTMI